MNIEQPCDKRLCSGWELIISIEFGIRSFPCLGGKVLVIYLTIYFCTARERDTFHQHSQYTNVYHMVVQYSQMFANIKHSITVFNEHLFDGCEDSSKCEKHLCLAGMLLICLNETYFKFSQTKASKVLNFIYYQKMSLT